MIQVKRRKEPSGFALRFAVAQFRIPFEDLVGGETYSVPGLVIDGTELLPERPDGWTYRTVAAFERQLADMTKCLDTRVRPFFADAETVLAEHQTTE